MDWSRQHVCESAGVDPGRLFQSLLSWIGRVNRTGEAVQAGTIDVSILVVVDWSRQRPVRLDRSATTRIGFNPCCRGLVASTRACDDSAFPLGMFQSLLSWIGRVNVRSTLGIKLTNGMFQSLLSWIGRVNDLSAR